MHRIKGVFRLIRWQNLLIMAAVQVLLRQCIIVPLLKVQHLESQFSAGDIIFLVLATVLIAAGGYAINDYFDRKIDMINRPQSVIAGKLMHPRRVMAWHLILTISGILFGTWIAWKSDLLYMSLVFIMISGLLWFYSTTYKRQLLLGTIIIAVLTAFVPFIVLLFELPLLVREYGSVTAQVTRSLLTWGLGISVFAFLLNFLREIVKDAEDFEGDHAFGKQTLPVVIGIKATKVIVSFILLLVVFLLVFAYFRFVSDVYSLVYFILFLMVPLLFTGGMIIKANTQKLFHTASILLKWIMLAGILYMVLVNRIINHFF